MCTWHQFETLFKVQLSIFFDSFLIPSLKRKQSNNSNDKLWQKLALGTFSLLTYKKCYKLASTLREILQGCHIQMPWAFVVPEWMRSRNFSASLLVNYTVPLRLIFSNKWRVVIIVEEPKFQAFIKCVKNYNHVLIVWELICKPVFQISIWNEKLKYEIKEVQKASVTHFAAASFR